MSRQVTHEELGNYTREDNPPKFNRRHLIGAAAAGAFAASFGGYSLASRSKGEASVSSNSNNQIDPEVTVEPAVNKSVDSVQGVVPNQKAAFELNTTIDPNIHLGRRSPEDFRQLAEESPEKLAEAFSITIDQVSALEYFPGVFAERYTEALNTGKSFGEFAAHTINNPTFTGDEQSWTIAKANYLAEAAETYDVAIVDGMLRVPKSAETYDGIFNDLTKPIHASRSLFFDHVRVNGDVNNALVMDVIDSEIEVRNTGRCVAVMDVQIADTQGSFSEIEGQIRVSGTPEDDGVFTVIINHQPENTIPFDELARLG